eukprot:symbB.v1.2.009043.t1/scaffold569.1/size186053/12
MDHADSEVLSAFAQRQCCTGFGWAVTSIVVLLLSVAILQVNDLIQLFWLGTLVNVALSITKLALAQVTAHPKALMADAVHGLGDTAAEVVTALAYVEAARPPDKEHPWGHGKIESIGAVVVTCILLYIAFSMGYDSITSLVPLLTDAFERRGQSAEKEAVDKPPESACQSETGLERRVRRAAIAVGLASVFLKEALYHATLDAGEQVQSKLAVATAWHHRSDSLAAGVALTSQLGSALGCWPGLDPLGGGVVAAMLGHSAIDSFRDSGTMDWRRRSSTNSGLSRLEREREREIKTAFETFSPEGGSVGYHELKAAMRALMLPVKKADVLEAMRACGHSPDAVLEFKDFAQIIRRKFVERDPLAAMLQTFRLFDSSGSGRLSLRDLRKAVKEAKLPIQEHELEHMISFFDQNASGTIGEAEFVQVMVATDLQYTGSLGLQQCLW